MSSSLYTECNAQADSLQHHNMLFWTERLDLIRYFVVSLSLEGIYTIPERQWWSYGCLVL